MKTIVKMVYGSHLYGTDTELSDKDYKGIYLPELSDCILGKVKHSISETTGDNHSKNSKDDVDNEMYSVQQFIKMACAGETIAIDMLHVPEQFIIEKTPVWDFIHDRRNMFYTKNMKAFVGFARSQAKRYSVKGERLQTAVNALRYLETCPEMNKLGEHFVSLVAAGGTLTERDNFGNFFVDINGRKLSETVTVKYAKDKINLIIKEYGKRAEKAKEAGGVDWKAISHAVRAALEVKEIYETGDLIFPLKDRKLLLEIKEGKIALEKVMTFLDTIINKVDEYSVTQPFPEKVNEKYWEDFIVNLYKF